MVASLSTFTRSSSLESVKQRSEWAIGLDQDQAPAQNEKRLLTHSSFSSHENIVTSKHGEFPASNKENGKIEAVGLQSIL